MGDDDLRQHQRFALTIEQAVRMANREVLQPVIGTLSEDRILAVAVEVAKRRGAYISATMDLGNSGENRPTGDVLRALRLEYEETRDAFANLMTSIERGYIDLPDN